MKQVPIRCESENCSNRDKIFNVVHDIEEGDVDRFYEAFGHGGEDDADYCPKCKELGTPQDGEDDEGVKYELEEYADEIKRDELGK